jgi:sugar transferase (PEP-CTERM/EpsH1 system associated)
MWDSVLRILYMAPRLCVPTNTGAHLRNFYLSKELAARAQVTFLAFANQNGEAYERAMYSCDWGAQRVMVIPQPDAYSFGKIIRGATSKTPLPILNYTTPEMTRMLTHLLSKENFDVVQVESVHLSAYLPIIRAARSRPLVICDWHNIESELMYRYSEHASNPLRKLYARMTARRLEEVEQRVLRECDGHFTVSERDRDKLLELEPTAKVFVADNGVDIAFYTDQACKTAYQDRLNQRPDEKSKPRPRSLKRHRLLFVGSMDYHANIDAVTYFAQQVWSEIYHQNREIVFTIVGRNPAKEVLALADMPGVEVTGTVADVRPYYEEAFASIVPLRIGGGSRLKILESMAARVPVISTRLGAEGIDVCADENILLADSKAELAHLTLELFTNRILRERLAASAHSFALRRYDWSAIGRGLLAKYEELLTVKRFPNPVVAKAMDSARQA